jgi:hypothetical protein
VLLEMPKYLVTISNPLRMKETLLTFSRRGGGPGRDTCRGAGVFRRGVPVVQRNPAQAQ